MRELECQQNLFQMAIQENFYLQLPLSFGHLNIFGMPVPHFGPPFGTWHAAIYHTTNENTD